MMEDARERGGSLRKGGREKGMMDREVGVWAKVEHHGIVLRSIVPHVTCC